jgi:hypothetical protein
MSTRVRNGEVVVAVVAICVTAAFSIASYLQADRAEKTSDALARIEERRAAIEERDASVANLIGDFFAGQCADQVEYEAFPLERWFSMRGQIDRQTVEDRCRGFQQPTRALETLSVIGPLEARRVHVLATLRFENDGAPADSPGEVSHLDLVLERGDLNPHEMRIKSIFEVVVHGA